MDSSYLDQREKNYWIFIIPVILIIAVIVGIYYWVKGSNKLISPLPETPNFEVIFITPTDLPTSPTSSPSATPKGKKGATNTPKPTVKATASPSPKVTEAKTTATVTPSIKATATPTVKPTS